jgi:hypothetical protein
MTKELDDKLQIISDVWRNFIMEYPKCRNGINFTKQSQSNYFLDILGYFQDTLDLIFKQEKHTGFASHISLLQAVYIQQDFIEEMLIIFKTGLTKKDLKGNENYSINREVRNELVGHPIRKIEGKIKSSSLYGYTSSSKSICYLRYREDNNFKFESVEIEINDILKRHYNLIVEYFNLIIEKLKLLLENFKSPLNHIKESSTKINFESLVKLIGNDYPDFLKNTQLYDEKSILHIYTKRREHRRYRIVYNQFMEDLIESIDSKISYCENIFNLKDENEYVTKEIPLFDENGKFISLNIPKKRGRKKNEYHYELGKLATKISYQDFRMYSGFLKAKCKNKIVLLELDRMETNIGDKIEYLCSERLIRRILKED